VGPHRLVGHGTVDTELRAWLSKKPSNIEPYNAGPVDLKSLNPTVGTAGNVAPSVGPALLAGLPSMLLPGLAVLVVIALLRLFRNPILRLLGVNPSLLDPNNRPPPYGYPPPYGQAQYPGPPNAYGWGAPAPPNDIEANLQQLLQRATPEEAEQLRMVADRMRARAAPAPAPLGSLAARPSTWVTPDSVPSNIAEALSPEERRQQARDRARAAASGQAPPPQPMAPAQTWTQPPPQQPWPASPPPAPAARVEVPPGTTFSSLEDDQKLVAIASVVLTAFVVSEADARGYQTK